MLDLPGACCRIAAFAALTLASAARPAAAQEAEAAETATVEVVEPTAPSSERPQGLRWQAATLFMGGAAAAFVAHESGHLAANYALGNEPKLEPVRYMGAIPFFSLDPGIHCQRDECTKRDGKTFTAGRRGLFLILSAGIQVQQYTDEIILTQEPSLRDTDAPFRKGMLTFNTLTSIGYVLSNWAGTEPVSGDLRSAYHDTRAPRNVMNLLVIGAAGLDIARYYNPDAKWLAWLSRAAKVATTGIVFTI